VIIGSFASGVEAVTDFLSTDGRFYTTARLSRSQRGAYSFVLVFLPHRCLRADKAIHAPEKPSQRTMILTYCSAKAGFFRNQAGFGLLVPLDAVATGNPVNKLSSS
jgi:hypothetical protein